MTKTVDPVGRGKDCKSDSRGSIPPTVSKRFSRDYTKAQLVDLLLWHWNEHIAAKSALADLRDKHITVSKELSALKRAGNGTQET